MVDLRGADHCLRIVWYLTPAPERALVIEWTERGKKEPAGTGGFGTRLIRSLVTGELGGELESELTESSLHVRMTVPQRALS